MQPAFGDHHPISKLLIPFTGTYPFCKQKASPQAHKKGNTRGGLTKARPCNFPRSRTESPVTQVRIEWVAGVRTKTKAQEICANKKQSCTKNR